MSSGFTGFVANSAYLRLLFWAYNAVIKKEEKGKRKEKERRKRKKRGRKREKRRERGRRREKRRKK